VHLSRRSPASAAHDNPTIERRATSLRRGKPAPLNAARRAYAAANRGTLTAPAHMRPFAVYSGYFTDPDGHLFEIAWNSNQ
jgi:catechol 2,3-dioxygenase-like lactoylglutathione lyase family enzyme